MTMEAATFATLIIFLLAASLSFSLADSLRWHNEDEVQLGVGIIGTGWLIVIVVLMVIWHYVNPPQEQGYSPQGNDPVNYSDQ